MKENLTNWIRSITASGGIGRARGLVPVVSLLVLAGIVAAVLYHARSADEPKPGNAAVASPAAEDNPLSGFTQAAGNSDIWQTQSQRSRQWQVAKMAGLGRMIRQFPAVSQATVMFEPGQKRRLGSAGVAPTAAVHVSLQPNAMMSSPLLNAIVDLVAGSIPGLDKTAVCVVDSSGRSYRPSDSQPLPGDQRLRRQQITEAQAAYAREIRSVLGHLPGLSVQVKVADDNQTLWCESVTMAVPRSYFTRIYELSGAAGAGPEQAVMDALVAEEKQRLAELAARIAGIESADVNVEWFYGLPTPCPATHDAAVESAGIAAWFILPAVAVCGLIGVIIAWRIARHRRRLAWARVRAMARRRKGRPFARQQDACPFESLKRANIEDLIPLLAAEEPETTALVLAHLSPARAARVLTGLGGSRQIEVARQIAELDRIDPAILRRAEQRLSARLVTSQRQRNRKPGGVTTAARILAHTGQAGRKKVLEALSRQHPELAETISRRILGFEDIAELPAERLAQALEPLGSEDLALALWTVNERLQEKILSALPADQCHRVRRQMEKIGPVRLTQVESAQQQVVEMVRKFETHQLACGIGSESEMLA
ncbi:MAG: hypothetical protein K8S55_03865 [Phycisphaerae bacterium]|nr:hypothetical protein [Phycisphaerae bacterium]